MLASVAQVISGENVSLGYAILASSGQELSSVHKQARLNSFYLINQFKTRPLSALDSRCDKRSKIKKQNTTSLNSRCNFRLC